MTKEEICQYARECAQVFCRDHKIDEQEHEDYLQEAAVAALKTASTKAVVNKGLISDRVVGALLDYWGRERNEGFGSKHVSSPEHVSLSETVTGAYDEDGDPLTYGDTLAYEDPPEGYGNPADELERSVDAARLLRAVKALVPEDQHFVEVALLSGLTQRAAAEKLGVSQQAVHRRTQTIVKRLRGMLL